ncbi:hypothetical protein J6590_088165, partial [Homalodisca vitripennis]
LHVTNIMKRDAVADLTPGDCSHVYLKRYKGIRPSGLRMYSEELPLTMITRSRRLVDSHVDWKCTTIGGIELREVHFSPISLPAIVSPELGTSYFRK